MQAPHSSSGSLFCLDVTHHSELGLGLLHQILLLGLADAGEDARLRVEVQNVALEIREEVAKTADTAHSHHTLGENRKKETVLNVRKNLLHEI